MLLNFDEQNVAAWRANWKKKKTKKLLSIVGICSEKAIIEEAVKRGYAPSVQNTALKKEKYGTRLQNPREQGSALLVEALNDLFGRQSIKMEDFAEWEKSLAENLRRLYKNNGIEKYTFGNAQKWINMAIKYVVSSDGMDWGNEVFKVCYLPIDITVMRKAKQEFKQKPLSTSWSKNDNWEEIEQYQEELRKNIQKKYNCSRLWWECNIW